MPSIHKVLKSKLPPQFSVTLHELSSLKCDLVHFFESFLLQTRLSADLVYNSTELAMALQSANFKNYVLVFTHFNHANSLFLGQLMNIWMSLLDDQRTGSIYILIDSVSVLSNLPLTLQMNINVTANISMSNSELCLDVVNILIENNILPSKEILSSISSLIEEERMYPGEVLKYISSVCLEYFYNHSMNSVPEAQNILNCYRILRIFVDLFGGDQSNLDELYDCLLDIRIQLPLLIRRTLSLYKRKGLDEFSGRLVAFYSRLESSSMPIDKDLLSKLFTIGNEMSSKGASDKNITALEDLLIHWILSNITENRNSRIPRLNEGTCWQKISNPRIMETLQYALTTPSFYLEGKAVCKKPQFIPDTCHLYNIVTSCGRFVNIHDAFISFNSIINSKKAISSEAVMKRFIRKAHELQLMGFIVPTKKRKEHYERVVIYNHSPNE